MKRKIIAIFMTLALTVTMAACGGGEETTISGMVVSVDGTVISLIEMDDSIGAERFSTGERPEMPEGMEAPQGFGEFDSGDFDGTLPKGETFPQWEEGEMPEGMTPPKDMTMPENGEMPDFGDKNGGMRPGFGNFGEDMETTDVDIANAHISVEIDGGKASGSMEDLIPGAFVTITMNGKGEVTNVLVSSQTGFDRGRRPTN